MHSPFIEKSMIGHIKFAYPFYIKKTIYCVLSACQVLRRLLDEILIQV